jgi:hypothetical protein
MTQPIENDNITENNPTDTVVEPKKLSYEELEAELKSVRSEAASRRIANRELEAKAKQWEEYEDSQKTELQKLQDDLAKRDVELSEYRLGKLKHSVVKEFGLDSEDEELLTGSDEATIRKQAEKLKARLGKVTETTSRPADLLAGSRGTPIGGSDARNPIDDLIRGMARGQ